MNFGAGIDAAWIAYDFGRTAWRVDAARTGVESATARAIVFGRASGVAAREQIKRFALPAAMNLQKLLGG